ncbi:MAG: CbtB-domain containing protein [bacterium]|nr:CbtB-domain containing protein [bacterium]
MAHTAAGVSQSDAMRLSALGPALAATLLGIFLIYGAGFAQPQVLHDAAHDSRHALGFVCH